jgi:hypothetical protein
MSFNQLFMDILDWVSGEAAEQGLVDTEQDKIYTERYNNNTYKALSD